MGSSSLNADVNALDRLQIVRGRNSSYFGSKYTNHRLGDGRDFRHCGGEVRWSINVDGRWLHRGYPMVIASELKPGMFLRIEEGIYKVLEAEAKAGSAKLGGVVKPKLCNVTSRRMWEPHFRLQERLEDLEVEGRMMEFLFDDAETCTFMDPNTFEQIAVPRAILGPAYAFLQAGMELPVEFFEGRALSVVFPDIVEAKVANYSASDALTTG